MRVSLDSKSENSSDQRKAFGKGLRRPKTSASYFCYEDVISIADVMAPYGDDVTDGNRSKNETAIVIR